MFDKGNARRFVLEIILLLFLCHELILICIFLLFTLTGQKYIKTKLPITKKKEKWSADTLIDGRYEPAQIIQVLEVIAGCKNENINEIAEQYYQNANKLFF